MDSRAVSTIVGFGTGTINSWINHNLVPGMKPGERGRPHRFDLEALTHLTIMADMVRMGFEGGFASQIAQWRKGLQKDDKRLLLADSTWALQMITRPAGKVIVRPGAPAAVLPEAFKSEDEDLIEKLTEFKGGRPAVYVVVDLEALEARARQAWEEWEREQACAKADG